MKNHGIVPYDPDKGEWANTEKFIEDLRKRWSNALSD